MWIEKVKDGYRFRETYADTLTGKRRKVAVTMKSKTKAAQKAAYELLQERINATMANPSRTLLSTLIGDFLASKDGFVKAPTMRNYHTTIKKIYTFLPPHTIVANLHPGNIQSMLNEVARTISKGYASKIRVLLHQAWAIGYMNGKVASMDTIDRTTVPKVQKTVQEVKEHGEKFLTGMELKEVLALIRKESPIMADVFEFQARTGLRFGELAALREEDFDGKAVEVNGTYVWTERKRGTPKNAYSVRIVPLDDKSVNIVERFIIHNKQQRAWFNRKDSELYIFTTGKGGPIDIAFANKILRSIHYHKRLSTHIFRHTHVSLLAESGVSLKAIMARVGHNDPATTMAIYTHVTDSMKDEAVKAMNDMK